MTPYLYTFIELIFVNDRHDKFYRAFLDRQTNEVFYHYGPNSVYLDPLGGSYGRHDTYPTLDAAHEALMKQVRSKVSKGYTANISATLTCAQKFRVPRDAVAYLTKELRRSSLPPSDIVIANV